MIDKITKCLNDLRCSQKKIGRIESALNSYGGYADPNLISKEMYKNFCKFIFNTELENEKILKYIEKYGSYKNYIDSKNSVQRFFIQRNQMGIETKKVERKISRKKYTTYSAHGHFGTNNPLSVILNYIAMIPAYMLMLLFSGIGLLFKSLLNIFKSNKNQE